MLFGIKKKKEITRRGDFVISHLGLDLRFQLWLNLQALCIKNSRDLKNLYIKIKN